MGHFIPTGMEWAISFQLKWNDHFIPAGMEWAILFRPEWNISLRRQIKHRGSGKSILGRPLKEKSKKLQLQVLKNEEFLSYSLPSLKTKPASVASNRAGEQKH